MAIREVQSGERARGFRSSGANFPLGKQGSFLEEVAFELDLRVESAWRCANSGRQGKGGGLCSENLGNSVELGGKLVKGNWGKKAPERQIMDVI